MVRLATQKDFKSILEIEESLIYKPERLSDLAYRLDIQKNGFLLPSTFNHSTTLENATEQYLIEEREGNICGFLRIDDSKSFERERNGFIYKPEYTPYVRSENTKYLGRIAVPTQFRKQGIAMSLVSTAQDMLREQKTQYIFSFVVVYPIINISSILFHEAAGFERVDICEPFNFFGFPQYQSFLYGKKLF